MWSGRVKHRRKALVFCLFWVVVAILSCCCCCRTGKKIRREAVKDERPIDPTLVLVTGYCNCEKCCGWKKSWFGFGGPVYDYGPMKGKPKKVGVTASGTTAHHGTIAADTKVFKMGTRLNVPGYGVGTVEDVGGAIKRRHIDIWFPSHLDAIKWGRKWLKVTEVGSGTGKK